MSEWRRVALGDILSRVKRPVKLRDEKTYETLGVRWYGAGCFLKPSQAGATIAAKTLYAVEPGDIVYSRLFAWKGSFGVVRAAHAGAVASNEFPTFRADNRLLPGYFALWAARQEVWDEAAAASSGTTANSRNRLSEDDFLAIEMDLPSISEQRAVIAAVDTVDALLDALRDEAASTERLARAAGAAWIDNAPCEAVALSGVLESVRTGVSPRCEPGVARTDEWGVLKLSAVRPSRFDALEAKPLPTDSSVPEGAVLRGGEVLVTRSNTLERVGAACRVPVRLEPLRICPDLIFRLEPDTGRVDADYLVFALGTPAARVQIQDAAVGTSDSMKKISAASLRALEIPLPPLDEQRDIASDLLALWQAAHRAFDEFTRVEALRTALIEDLVSGARTAPPLVSV